MSASKQSARRKSKRNRARTTCKPCSARSGESELRSSVSSSSCSWSRMSNELAATDAASERESASIITSPWATRASRTVVEEAHVDHAVVEASRCAADDLERHGGREAQVVARVGAQEARVRVAPSVAGDLLQLLLAPVVELLQCHDVGRMEPVAVACGSATARPC